MLGRRRSKMAMGEKSIQIKSSFVWHKFIISIALFWLLLFLQLPAGNKLFSVAHPRYRDRGIRYPLIIIMLIINGEELSGFALNKSRVYGHNIFGSTQSISTPIRCLSAKYRHTFLYTTRVIRFWLLFKPSLINQ